MRDVLQRALLRVVKDPDARQAEAGRLRSEAALSAEIERLPPLRAGEGDLVMGLALWSCPQ